jgi:hypoxanthine phosphoribosyltransferase
MAESRKNIQVMHSEQDISKRVAELGELLSAYYSGKELIVIGLLNGVFPFFADLTRAMDLDFQVSFMRVSSYGSGQVSSGNVKILLDVDIPIQDKNLLIVEDIVDTGQTLAYVLKHLQKYSPADIRICTLLDKPARRVVEVPIDYVGFTIDDQFVVGYGMDAGGLYRNLPYVGIYGTDGKV